MKWALWLERAAERWAQDVIADVHWHTSGILLEYEPITRDLRLVFAGISGPGPPVESKSGI